MSVCKGAIHVIHGHRYDDQPDRGHLEARELEMLGSMIASRSWWHLIMQSCQSVSTTQHSVCAARI